MAGTFITRCPKCNYIWPKLQLATESIVPETIAYEPKIQKPAPQLSVMPTGVDIVTLAKARLADIEKQISQMAELQAEAEVIRQMLSAAKRTTKTRKTS